MNCGNKTRMDKVARLTSQKVGKGVYHKGRAWRLPLCESLVFCVAAFIRATYVMHRVRGVDYIFYLLLFLSFASRRRFSPFRALQPYMSFLLSIPCQIYDGCHACE
jgi:hypothetical protein